MLSHLWRRHALDPRAADAETPTDSLQAPSHSPRKQGGSKDRASKDGGSKEEARSKEGVSKEGVSKEGVSKEGGSKGGASKEGASKEGASKEGGGAARRARRPSVSAATAAGLLQGGRQASLKADSKAPGVDTDKALSSPDKGKGSDKVKSSEVAAADASGKGRRNSVFKSEAQLAKEAEETAKMEKKAKEEWSKWFVKIGLPEVVIDALKLPVR